MIKAALMYDFDKTLCTRNMQEYDLLPELGVEPDEFWREVSDLSRKENMESTLAYMYLLLEKSRDRGFYVKRERFYSKKFSSFETGYGAAGDYWGDYPTI